jgi:hypothetical protein
VRLVFLPYENFVFRMVLVGEEKGNGINAPSTYSNNILSFCDKLKKIKSKNFIVDRIKWQENHLTSHMMSI